MATILVVDDVPAYCEELAAALTRDGNTLRTASTLREAIDVGILLEPDVLITDWMLSDRASGLDVAEVLKQVYPSMKTILMSGYASKDLLEDVKQFGAIEFIEKPFEMTAVRQALHKAQFLTRSRKLAAPIGIVETFENGVIGHLNQIAEEMFNKTEGGAFSEKLSEIFSDKDWQTLQDKSLQEWINVTPLGCPEQRWHLRSKKIENSEMRVWAILDSADVHLKDSSINLLLLGFSDKILPELEGCGHILIVDDLAFVRRLASEILRGMKLFCHTAEDYDEAARIFIGDPEITHVMLDYSAAKGATLEIILRMKALRPDVIIIGSGEKEDFRRFSDLSVEYFLPKPWDYESFLKVLVQSNSKI